MNLGKVAASAERLATALDRPPVTADVAWCLHARDKTSACDVCLHGCPVGAIMLAGKIALDAQKCVGCGLCLHNCPMGVFSGHDDSADVLNCAVRLPDRDVIEVACSRHPDPAHGSPGIDVVIRTSGCLAALAPSTYLNLLALEVRRIVVRLDACGQCPIGRVMPEIHKTVGVAQGVLEARGEPERLCALEIPERRQRTRPVIDSKNPPVSRRDFFRKFAAKTTRHVSELFPPLPEVAPGQKSPPPERRRLIGALRQLPTAKGEVPLAEGLPFARFAARADCTACGVCARACPTGALQLRTVEDRYELTFAAGDCTDCGVCLKFCRDGALRRDSTPRPAELLSQDPVALVAGPLKRCAKCGAPFAGQAESTLCPICEMRRRAESETTGKRE